MFKRILLATDGSARSEEALKYAWDLALRDEAQVFIVHAFEPAPSYLGDPWQAWVTGRHVAAGQG